MEKEIKFAKAIVDFDEMKTLNSECWHCGWLRDIGHSRGCVVREARKVVDGEASRNAASVKREVAA